MTSHGVVTVGSLSSSFGLSLPGFIGNGSLALPFGKDKSIFKVSKSSLVILSFSSLRCLFTISFAVLPFLFRFDLLLFSAFFSPFPEEFFDVAIKKDLLKTEKYMPDTKIFSGTFFVK